MYGQVDLVTFGVGTKNVSWSRKQVENKCREHDNELEEIGIPAGR